MPGLFRTLLHRVLPHDEPWRSLTREALFIAALAVLIITLEWLYGRDIASRYRSRNFLNDLAWSFFYQGGIYNLLIYAPIFGALQKRLAFTGLHVFSALPPAAGFAAFWLAADFLGYWIHRLQHSTPFLWAFHSIHHTPKRLTFLTSNRNHPIEQLIANLIMFVPILILGVPQTIWIPFLLVHSLLEALQHSALAWKFGPFYRLLVSPMFHNLHHSTKASEYNGNYAKILSVWDFVFGTAVNRDELPAEFGVEGIEVPENLGAQLLWPFRMLWGRKTDVATVAPEPAP